MAPPDLPSGGFAQWVIAQLHTGKINPNDYLNFRAIVNKRPEPHPQTGTMQYKTEPVFNKNVQFKHFRSLWFKSLFPHLYQLNMREEDPANAYFGVNSRTDAHGNHEKHVPHYTAFYLDCDQHGKFTREQREMQVKFWVDSGFEPSFVVSTGQLDHNGFHVYWVLDRLYEIAEAKEFLKRMTLITGCKVKGNVFDSPRVLRLPGFHNRKKWWEEQKNLCYISYPHVEEIKASYHEKRLMPRYSLDQLKDFPHSDRDNVMVFVREAHSMGGDYKENLKALVAQNQHTDDIAITAFGLKQKQKSNEPTEPKAEWEPTNKVIPELDDIPFPKKFSSWLKIYCTKGLIGLSATDIEKIKKATNWEPEQALDASELDAKVMYWLIRANYTREAILTFWMRPTLRLFREDKMQRNPNYLNLTFDEMLLRVQSYMRGETDQEQQNKAIAHTTIQISNCKTFFKSGDNLTELLNGEPILESIFTDQSGYEDEKEYFKIKFKCPAYTNNNGSTEAEYVKFMPRKAFNGIPEFKKHMTGFMGCYAEKSAPLSHLLSHLQYKYANCKKYSFHSKINYAKNQFLFPTLEIDRKNIKPLDIAENLDERIREKLFWYDSFNKDMADESEIKEIIDTHWSNYIHLHLPRVVLSVLGMIGISAIRPILLEKGICDTFEIPTLNIRGHSHCGKTISVWNLYKFIGFLKKLDAVIDIFSSKFSLDRVLNMTNFIPLFFDEFKEEEGSEYKIQQIRDLVRRGYSGSSMLRGRADLSLVSSGIQSSLIIVGETQLERIGNVAECTRTIGIDASDFNPNDATARKRFHSLEGARTNALGPHFYKYLLNLDHKGFYAAFRIAQDKMAEQLKDSFSNEVLRIAHNLTAIEFGCKLIDRFIRKHSTTAPLLLETHDYNEHIVDYIKTNVKDVRQTLSYTDNKGKRKVIANNELFQFVDTLSVIILSGYRSNPNQKLERIFKENEDMKKLAINPKLAYELYVHYCKSQNARPAQLTKIYQLVKTFAKQKEHFLYHNKERSTLNVKLGGSNARCFVFCLLKLREMEIWHPKIEEEKKDLFEPQTKNRIEGFSEN